jgi:nitrogenase molybdenum-iron protein NifN
MNAAADLLRERTGVPDHRFDHLMGLEANDLLVNTLARIAGNPVPESVERQRAQLQDAMLDSHFMLGQTRLALALEPDLLAGFSQMLAGLGAETVAAVSPINAPVLAKARCVQVKIGDLEDLEQAARAGEAEVLIGNSHAAHTAERLRIPLVRAGFPQYDLLGGYQRLWIGYQGTRATLFELANTLLRLERGEIHPYRSILSPRAEASAHPEAAL